MREIRETPELRRILTLPRRTPRFERLELSELLRTPAGTMQLRPLQALALKEIWECSGGFLPLDVGEGKTLISLLAAYVLSAKSPLLLLPAHLIQKTARERDELSRHWLIPTSIRLMSYQMLGLVQSAAELDVYEPDLIIADESQKLKNRDAAVTKRVEKYMKKHPTTKFVAMTGTIMRKSLRDFAHIVRWCLKDKAPIPTSDAEVDEWALALDETNDEFTRLQPGALLKLAVKRTGDDVLDARQGFRDRLRQTPGIVCSAEGGTEVKAGLRIVALRYDVKPITNEHFRTLREEWTTPDGWELMEAVDLWRHAKELALGFHSIWDPRPPLWWSQPRSAWFKWVRDVLSRSRTFDSPLHLELAVRDEDVRKKFPRLAEGVPLLEAWRAVRDRFVPNPVPVWHDDSALRVAAKWMARPGIIWTEHVAFAERLSQLSGCKYYGAKGLAADGSFVDDGDPKRAIIVSVDANREGRNLQKKWHRNLVVSPEEGADKWQQLIGRTHRPGQSHDVTVDVFLGCAEHARAWSKAVAGAESIRDTVGSESKLLAGDITWPDEDDIASWSGPRWGK